MRHNLKLTLLDILYIPCNTWAQQYSRIYKIDLDRVIDSKEYSKLADIISESCAI